MFKKMLAVSSSIVGTIFSENSITVTFDPNLSKQSLTPALYSLLPITAKFFGILENSKAPVEETISFSSISTLLITDGTEPVAIKIFLALNSSPFTETKFCLIIFAFPSKKKLCFSLTKNQHHQLVS